MGVQAGDLINWYLYAPANYCSQKQAVVAVAFVEQNRFVSTSRYLGVDLRIDTT